MDKFKVSEHIDFEALIDVREFVLKIKDWELPLLTKKNKVTRRSCCTSTKV